MSAFPDFEPNRHWLTSRHDFIRERYVHVTSHPVWQALWYQPMSPYARSRLFILLSDKKLSNLTYTGFVMELVKPNGGSIGQYRYVGKSVIENFRQACVRHMVEVQGEYGYA